MAYSSVDKKSTDGEMPVRLCNYTNVYYNDAITADLQFMEATASRDQVRLFGLRAGDVLITKDSETADDIGVAAFVPESLDGVVCGYHLAVLRPKTQRIDPKYLFWSICSQHMREQMTAFASGVTRYGLRFGDTGGIQLFIPDLAKQRAVARFLDRETARLDAVLPASTRLLEVLQLRRRAYVDGLLGKGKYPEARAKAVVHLITSGPRGWADYFSEEGRPFLRITNLRREGIELSQNGLVRVVPPENAEGERTRIAGGDVLVSITADVGSIGVVPAAFEGGHISQHLALLRPNRAKIEPRWLAVALYGSACQAQLDSARYGGTKTQLSLEDVGEVRLPVPPLDEQRRLLDRWSEMESLTRKLLMGVKGQLWLLRERRQALITAAVTGQILVSERVR